MELKFDNIATKYVDRLKDSYDPNRLKSRNQDVNETTKIHRIVPVSRFKELLEGRMTIVNPSFWEKNDPKENFLYDIEFKEQNPYGFPFPDKDDFYAQCWSMNKNSYAMWSIYAQEERGIMITSSIEKMTTCFGNENDLFVGKVEYLSEEELIRLIEESANGIREKICIPGHYGKIDALLIKRKAYHYEQEVRLIKYAPDNQNVNGLFTLQGFNFHDLISQVTLDPRMSDIECEVWENYLSNFDITNIGGRQENGGRRRIQRNHLLRKKKIRI